MYGSVCARVCLRACAVAVAVAVACMRVPGRAPHATPHRTTHLLCCRCGLFPRAFERGCGSISKFVHRSCGQGRRTVPYPRRVQVGGSCPPEFFPSWHFWRQFRSLSVSFTYPIVRRSWTFECLLNCYGLGTRKTSLVPCSTRYVVARMSTFAAEHLFTQLLRAGDPEDKPNTGPHALCRYAHVHFCC